MPIYCFFFFFFFFKKQQNNNSMCVCQKEREKRGFQGGCVSVVFVNNDDDKIISLAHLFFMTIVRQ